MSSGRVTGDEAVLLGKLRIKGDVELGRKFEDFFAPPGEEPQRAASRLQPERETSRYAAPRKLVGRVFRRLSAA